MLSSELVQALRAAKHIVASTGAGISAESGVPTFRDAQTGLWSKYRPEEPATPEAFLQNPKTVWDWYGWRREPHAADALIVEINPDTTPLTPRAHHVLRGAAGEILPQLARALARQHE